MKKFRYIAEAFAVKLGMWFFGFLSLETASNFSSFVSRFVGKKLWVNNLAKNNILSALPHLSSHKADEVIDQMWDNLGRVIGEYPHVSRIAQLELMSDYVEMDKESEATVRSIIKKSQDQKKGSIIFSGHLANWEVGPKRLSEAGIDVATIYRPLNNPYVEKITSDARKVKMIKKGRAGSRDIIKSLLSGQSVIILIDQRASDGIRADFFHKEALTTASVAKIAIKYDIDVIPARVVRIGREFKFQIFVEPALNHKAIKKERSDLKNFVLKMNKVLEGWIKQNPGQWFWVHNRWK